MGADAVRTKQLLLRGYTRPTFRGTVIAECVDLDIATEGNTTEEAMAKMRDALAGYLEVAFTREGGPEGLVPRRAPLSSWFWYYAIGACERLSHARRTAFQAFTLPQTELVPSTAAC